MNAIADIVDRIFKVKAERQGLQDAVRVMEEVMRRGYFGRIADLTDAQKRLLLAERERRAAARAAAEEAAQSPAPAEGGIVAGGTPPPPEPDAAGRGVSTKRPLAGEAKSTALSRAIEAFCMNRPMQRSDMAALAASG